MHKTFITGSIFNVLLQTKTAFLGPLKQKGLVSIPLRLSLFFKKVVVCGHSLVVTLSLTINSILKLLSSLPILMQESFSVVVTVER